MRTLIAVALLGAGATTLRAQSLASRVNQADGAVQVIYPSRPGACGDGTTFISNVLSPNVVPCEPHQPLVIPREPQQPLVIPRERSERRDLLSAAEDPRCQHGPARVVATVVSGAPTRLRAYVGPVPSSNLRTITASVAEARAWLEQLVTNGSTRLSEDAVLPFILADSTDPWPVLLRVARDDQRPQSLRRNALMWLSAGVNDHLGIADATADTDDDELRRQAVFVLSQRARREGDAELVDLARTSKRAAVRRDAIFWLSQTGEIGAVAALYAELLGER